MSCLPLKQESPAFSNGDDAYFCVIHGVACQEQQIASATRHSRKGIHRLSHYVPQLLLFLFLPFVLSRLSRIARTHPREKRAVSSREEKKEIRHGDSMRAAPTTPVNLICHCIASRVFSLGMLRGFARLFRRLPDITVVTRRGFQPRFPLAASVCSINAASFPGTSMRSCASTQKQLFSTIFFIK